MKILFTAVMFISALCSAEECKTRFILDRVDVHEKPLESGKVVGRLEIGDRVEACEKDAEFSKVKISGAYKGWVQSQSMSNDQVNYASCVKRAKEADQKHALTEALQWAERSAQIAERKENLDLLLNLYTKAGDQNKASVIRKKIKALSEEPQNFSSSKCIDLRSAEGSSEILEKNPWIKTVFQDDSDNVLGVRAVTYYKTAKGKKKTINDACTYCNEWIDQISCKKGLIAVSGGVGDADGGSWTYINSLWDGSSIIEGEPSPSYGLDFVLSIEGKPSRIIKLHDCREFESAKKCKVIWSDKVWRGKDEECLKEGEDAVELDVGRNCGGGFFEAKATNQFQYYKAKNQLLVCQIDEKTSKVHCNKSK